MSENFETNQDQLLERAVEGDKQALEELMAQVQTLVFNLSLRMLGAIPDAEDASQEILIKVMTGLSGFRRESAFSTWVYRIACNHLQNYKKGMFSTRPLSFEIYGADIRDGKTSDVPDMTQGVDHAMLEQELKYSCTNVMLQCLEPESRCVFILGTMMRADSRLAGEALGMTPENYRQKLSRARRKVSEFLKEYCGLAGGRCQCGKRVNYAIASHRINPQALDYSNMKPAEKRIRAFQDAMEEFDTAAAVFAALPQYQPSVSAGDFLKEILNSDRMAVIRETEAAGE